MIVETCPRCGAILVNFALALDPLIPKKYCPYCGWSWTGEPEEVIRIPFDGNSYTEFNMTRHCDPAFANSPCRTCSNNPVNGGSGICFCTLGQPKFTY